MVLVHGFGTNGSTWSRWVPDLARDHRVLVVELKGFGNAPKPGDGHYSPMDQAELLYRLVLQRDLSDLTLVGHSLGGGIALLTALRVLSAESGRLRRLVVVAGAGLPLRISPWIRLSGRRFIGPLLLRLLPARRIMRKALELAYADPARVTRTQVETYAEQLRTREGRRALSWTARQLLPEGIEASVARLGEVTIPTLLLWGDRDRIVPRSVADRLDSILPNSVLEILPDCGHMPQEEKPGESLERVRSFLQSSGPGSPGGSAG